MEKVCFSTMSSEWLEFSFGTYKVEVLEIIFHFSLVFIRVMASKLFFVYADKFMNVNNIFFAFIL